MPIDLPTLMTAGSFVAAVSGVFLIFAAMQTKGAQGMIWWAAADITMAAAVPMLLSSGVAINVASVVVAITLLNVSPALILASAQACNGRRPDLRVIFAGAVIWLATYALPAIRTSPEAQVSLNLAIASVYVFAAAAEFWHGRVDRLTARGPLILLLVLHGIFGIGGAIAAAVGALSPINGTTLLTWLVFVHFETFAFVIGTSIFTVAMTRERQELLHKTNANTDSLTGLATRRAFYEEAEKVLAERGGSAAPVSLILFDLDAFKTINDTYGHGPGDEVLKKFAEAAKKMVRSTDIVGRIGGEEFAIMLPGAGSDAAYLVAERTRVAFTTASAGVGDFTATLSAGVARAHRTSTIDSLMKAADQALYRAKSNGRNRVELAEPVAANNTVTGFAEPRVA